MFIIIGNILTNSYNQNIRYTLIKLGTTFHRKNPLVPNIAIFTILNLSNELIILTSCTIQHRINEIVIGRIHRQYQIPFLQTKA